MVLAKGDDRRQVKLSQHDRQVLAWSSTPSRRQSIPSYTTTLQRGDVRTRTCATCRKVFANLRDMKKHIALTHTGTKPVVCEICGKRFDSTKHMLSHYELHKEPRLQEFGILTRRRKAQLEPRSSTSSATTVGTYHRIPKIMKDYVSNPSDGSFGTRQSFHVSQAEEKMPPRKVEHLNKIENMQSYLIGKNQSGTPNTNLPEIHPNNSLMSASKKTMNVDVRTDYQSRTQNLPRVDPGNISVIGSVVGMTRAIETSRESEFLQKTEDKLIRARLDDVFLAGRSPTPRSLRTKSSSFSERFRQRPPSDMPFWDSGSHTTRRMSGVTAISGYDPVLGKRSIKSSKTRVSILPNINKGE